MSQDNNSSDNSVLLIEVFMFALVIGALYLAGLFGGTGPLKRVSLLSEWHGETYDKDIFKYRCIWPDYRVESADHINALSRAFLDLIEPDMIRKDFVVSRKKLKAEMHDQKWQDLERSVVAYLCEHNLRVVGVKEELTQEEEAKRFVEELQLEANSTKK